MEAKELLKIRPIDETGKCIITLGNSPITQSKYENELEAQKWINTLNTEMFEMMITIAGEIFGARMELLKEEELKEQENKMSNEKKQ